MTGTMDVAAMRSRFPALDKGQIFLDNAGGTQALQTVLDSVGRYLYSANVQPGASYSTSQASLESIRNGHLAAAKFMNADASEIVFGASATQLAWNLRLALADHFNQGDEIVLTKINHESHTSPWLQLAKDRGLTVRWYEPRDRKNPVIEADLLKTYLNSRTRLVVCVHVSNILGTINDVQAIATEVHKIPQALLAVDGVAFTPHRKVDMKQLGVDFYSFSWYKVYGPHMSTMYASKEAQKCMRTLGHHFSPTNALYHLVGIGAGLFESVAAIPAVCEYLEEYPLEESASHEEDLSKLLIGYLLSRPDVRLWGQPVADKSKRVPVVTFNVRGRKSREVVQAIEAKSNIGCRWGAFYSNRLCQEVLGVDPAEGVVRISFVHYTSEAEVKRVIEVLDDVLSTTQVQAQGLM